MENILKKFFFKLLSLDWMYPFFVYVEEVLIWIFTIMNPYFKYNISFFAITNNFINATFLSRFIARKFEQNYRFYELINPIRRELCVVCRETKGSYSGYWIKRLKNRINLGLIKTYRKSIYKSFLSTLFLYYQKYSLRYHKKNSTLFSLICY